MLKLLCSFELAVLTVVAVALARPVHGSVFWNESVNGDLSSVQSSPNAFTLGSGVNTVIGTVGNVDFQDWLTLTIPSGFQLSSIKLTSYPAVDRGFTGFQNGTVFIGNAFLAASYAGYAHLDSPMVNQELLPQMAHPDASGFSIPLASGSYAFLIQQLDTPASYSFDYTVTPVPEPFSQMAAAILCVAFFLKRRWWPALKTSIASNGSPVVAKTQRSLGNPNRWR